MDPSDIYEQAQFMDEWPGEDYPGTSLLSAAQAAGATGVATGVAPAWLGTPEWEAECAEFGCHDEEDDWWTVGPDAHRWIPGD